MLNDKHNRNPGVGDEQETSKRALAESGLKYKGSPVQLASMAAEELLPKLAGSKDELIQRAVRYLDGIEEHQAQGELIEVTLSDLGMKNWADYPTVPLYRTRAQRAGDRDDWSWVLKLGKAAGLEPCPPSVPLALELAGVAPKERVFVAMSDMDLGFTVNIFRDSYRFFMQDGAVGIAINGGYLRPDDKFMFIKPHNAESRDTSTSGSLILPERKF